MRITYVSVYKRIRKNQENKGKRCKVLGCTHNARVKGFCMKCYDYCIVRGNSYEVNQSKSD